LASAITSLPWVADGIEGIERQALQVLVDLETLYGADGDPALTSKDWLADGVDQREVLVLRWLYDFVSYGEAEAGKLVRMPFLDSLDKVATDTLEVLDALGKPVNRRWLYPAVLAETWVEDGLNQSEIAFVDVVQELGPGALALALLEKPWIEDGLNESEARVLELLAWIARGDEDIALRIVAAPFLQTIEPVDSAAIETLWALGARSQDTLGAVVEKTWVEDGLDESETAFVQKLSRLANDSETTAVAIAEHLDAVDAESLDFLTELASRQRHLFDEIVEKSWVEDGLNGSEITFVQRVGGLAHNDELFRAVMEKPWVEDAPDEFDNVVVGHLGGIAHRDASASLRILAMPFLETSGPATAAAMEALAGLGHSSQRALNAALDMAWVRDGLDESEISATVSLWLLAGTDETAALQILGMPFLQSIEPADAGAMKALWILAAYRPPEIFQRVMGHPTLSGGITDEWADAVTVLGPVSDFAPDLIDVLLDPQTVEVEERVIDLPVAGATTLVIVRTQDGAPRSMDLLEDAVRNSVAFMGLPLPNSRAVLHFDDRYGDIGAAGVNFGTHIGMRSRYDADDDGFYADLTGPIMAHEVAHFYWRGKAWVAEGGASFLAAISENIRTGQPVDSGHHACTHAGSLAELEEQRNSERGCQYAFGQRLLLDLYRTLGEDTFRRGFRDLYLMSKAETLDISHYRAAFEAAAPERSAEIDAIVARWYEGGEAPKVYDPDQSPVDPRLPSVSGRVEDAYIVAADGNRRSNFSTRYTYDLWLRLRLSFRTQAEPRELRFTIEGYYEDGFAFWLDEVTVPVPAHRTSGDVQVWRAAGSTYLWAPGRYIVYVYHDGQKVAEVQFQFLRIT